MRKRTVFALKFDFSIKGRKLTNYLLNVEHAVGRSKARFFIGDGFSPSDPDILAVALLNHSTQPNTRVPTPHGIRIICEGPLPTPNGTAPLVRSIWQIDDRGIAELITAYPL